MINEKGKIINLDGITILYSKNKTNKASYVHFGILSGALNEKINGTAHLLEHLFFTETKNRKKEELLKDQEFININAATSFDFLLIKFYQSSKLLKKCFEVCSDMFFNTNITSNNIDKEKLVIKQEINKKLSNLIDIMYYKHEQNIYTNKRLGEYVVGTEESLSQITKKDLEEFKKKNFCKENFIVSIQTNKSATTVKSLVKKYILPHLSENKHFEKQTRATSSFEKINFLNIMKANRKDNVVLFTFKFMPNNFRDKAKIFFIKQAIISSNKSRFFKILRLKHNYIYSTPLFERYSNKDEVLYGLSFQTSKENIKPCLKEIQKIFSDARKNGLTKEEFDRIKEIENLYQDTEVPSPSSMPQNMIYQFVQYQRLISGKEDQKIFNSITFEEVNDYCKQVFSPSNVQMSVLGDATEEFIPTLQELFDTFIIKNK